MDWLASLYKVPWGAANHCNKTFLDFVSSQWGPGELADYWKLGLPPPHCPKYQDGEGGWPPGAAARRTQRRAQVIACVACSCCSQLCCPAASAMLQIAMRRRLLSACHLSHEQA